MCVATTLNTHHRRTPPTTLAERETVTMSNTTEIITAI
jgi:hypothetical protein